MKAALQFAQGLAADGLLFQVRRIQINLYGSLGATGRGHGSDRAVLLGLEGESPDIVNTDLVEGHLQRVRNTGSVWLLRQWAIPFSGKDRPEVSLEAVAVSSQRYGVSGV